MKQTEKPIPFAKLPKPLIAVPISNDAKLLYTLLNDRFQLSQKNGVADENGFTCCFYPNREIQASMQCAHGKATNLLRELESAGLIYRRRTGKGKPDRIYVGGIQDDDGEESECRFPAIRCADFVHAGMPGFGSLDCRLSAPNKNKKNNIESLQTEESNARLSGLLERLDLNSFYSKDAASALNQIRWHITVVMETEFQLLRISGRDYPTEEVRAAIDQLKKENVKAILDDFLTDPQAFGSMRARLYEAGLGNGAVLTSNVSWAHDTACQGKAP